MTQQDGGNGEAGQWQNPWAYRKSFLEWLINPSYRTQQGYGAGVPATPQYGPNFLERMADGYNLRYGNGWMPSGLMQGQQGGVPPWMMPPTGPQGQQQQGGGLPPWLQNAANGAGAYFGNGWMPSGLMSPGAQPAGSGWNSPLNTPTPTLAPPFQSQAPFQEPQGPWNMQPPPPGVGRGQPGPAWNPGAAQGRPASWNAPQDAGPSGPGGAQGGAGGLNTNGGPWWTDPYGNQSFSGFDWNQVVPWGNAQYTPGGPSPFAGQPVGAWEDITNNLRTMGYLDQQAFDQNQQGVQNNQWDRTFNANQGQQGIQNSQWDRNFAQQGSQWDRNFNANQAQQGIQNNQWDRTFGSNEAQRGWQNTFNQNEANRQADQWGQTFGANQAQQGWNNQYQTGRANAADSQWGQTFGANENQRGIENTRNQALDQWNQAFSQAGFDWRKQQDTEQNRLQDQGQNLAAFGRRFGPNVSYM